MTERKNRATITLFNSRIGTIEQVERVEKSDEEWKSTLTPTQFSIARKKGTEPNFSGAYHNFHGKGIYSCVCCGTDLFCSDSKFDSGTGWPSFYAPISDLNIRTAEDLSYGMVRVEVLCARCDAHLGHVFDDGPPPMHLRYCMNSTSLTFRRD